MPIQDTLILLSHAVQNSFYHHKFLQLKFPSPCVSTKYSNKQFFKIIRAPANEKPGAFSPNQSAARDSRLQWIIIRGNYPGDATQENVWGGGISLHH